MHITASQSGIWVSLLQCGRKLMRQHSYVRALIFFFLILGGASQLHAQCPSSCTTTSTLINVTITPADTADLCPNDSVLLDGFHPDIAGYCWSNGFTSSSIYASAPGTYMLVAFDTAGCPDTATVEVVMASKPFDVPDITVCPGTDFVADATDSSLAGWVWSTGDTTSAVTISNASGSYWLAMRDTNNCLFYDTFTVFNYTPGTLALGQTDTTVCPGDTVVVDAGSGFNNFNWMNGDSVQVVSVTTSGNVFLEATDSITGCLVYSDTFMVSNFPGPGTPTIIVTGFKLDAGNYAGYDWYYNDSLVSQSNPYDAINTGSGIYSVTVTDNDGCIDSTADTTIVFGITSNDIPKGFSPNGDGINDYWYLPSVASFVQNEVRVFNRWGGLVFEMNGYDNDDAGKRWDGTGKGGGDLPDGSYFYTIELNDASVPEAITGYVQIIR